MDHEVHEKHDGWWMRDALIFLAVAFGEAICEALAETKDGGA
jgi:hypothetical protein